MTQIFKDILNEEFTVEFKEHDISKYDVLFHVTLKEKRKSIEENGILLDQPLYKSFVPTGMIYLSYPIQYSTADLFRWRDAHHTLFVLDAQKLKEDGFIFYDDHFSKEDLSSNRNHLCCEKSIPKYYIKKIIEF